MILQYRNAARPGPQRSATGTGAESLLVKQLGFWLRRAAKHAGSLKSRFNDASRHLRNRLFNIPAGDGKPLSCFRNFRIRYWLRAAVKAMMNAS